MKIGMLVPEYHTESYKFGGLARQNGKIAHALSGLGHTVLVYVPSDRDEVFDESATIRVRRFKPRSFMRWRYQRFLDPSYRWAVGMYNLSRSARSCLFSDGKAFQPDVLYCNSSPEAFHSVFSGIPVVVCIGCYWPFYMLANFEADLIFKKRPWFTESLVTTLLKHAFSVHAPSGIHADLYGDITNRKVDVLRTPMFMFHEGNAWHSVAKKYDLPEKFILFYGSLQGVKGVHIFAESMRQIMGEDSSVHAVMIGRDRNGPNGEKMSEHLSQVLASFQGRVRILNPMDHNDLLSIVSAAECVVLPSLFDNLPNTLLESMHLGKVIVSTRGASLDEILVDGESGILVNPADAIDLYHGIKRALCMSRREQQIMGERARLLATTVFSPANYAGKLEAIFHSTKAARPPQPRPCYAEVLYFSRLFSLHWRGISGRERKAFQARVKRYAKHLNYS